MKKNIFTDGEIVHTFVIPDKVKKSAYEKGILGNEALANYVTQLFGNRFKSGVVESNSHNGSLTGTQVVIQKGNKRITFMLVEPKEPFRDEVHISKMVEDMNEGGLLDVIDYSISNKKKSEPFSSPFSSLGAIKGEFPITNKE